MGSALGSMAAPDDSAQVRAVLLARMSAFESKAENLYRVQNGAFLIGAHTLVITPIVETDTAMRGKNIFAMRLEVSDDGRAQPGATFGAIGIADDREQAIAIGLGEWYMGFGRPYFEALANKRPTMAIGDFDVFPGAMGLRGGALAGWMNDSDAMHQKLLAVALPLVQAKGELLVLDLKVSVSTKGAADAGCRVDAAVVPKLSTALAALDWPASTEGYIFKQAYVLKRRATSSQNR